MSAAAEEQTSAVRGIVENAESLSGRADELQSLVDRFDTSENDGADGGGNGETTDVVVVGDG
ncbi:hypothetical protein CYV19_02135 [Natronobacterium gregoryi SP2]|uniref:Methyl-accepting chemotaxis sensory transducer n=1 Tax=Natronobacterium gregoryi (strain ATCC 43098 / DSM 3393 / CCM 3738 / CIP 104747 / IAM 13177 / JCM 8860 / NBRC 102187 / NCIMB 2189 / SP2) TaxID=797304 RepID=L9Y6G5_NATGS|nr:methyl-accepting chemotaxis sensory transducer [Natronobacterium gregoryi SP2]PLK21915.1 hypothetical protein CYV19_02135 [Natronobacterium gregoryi SP2]